MYKIKVYFIHEICNNIMNILYVNILNIAYENLLALPFMFTLN